MPLLLLAAACVVALASCPMHALQRFFTCICCARDSADAMDGGSGDPTPDVVEADAGEPDAVETDVIADADEPAQLVDIDGNVYETVRIGDQVWMAENLRVRTLRDGTPVLPRGEADYWYYLPDKERAPAQYTEPRWALGTLESYLDGPVPEGYYGLLYNERALLSELLPPRGWRLPTPEDFEELIAFAEANGEGATATDALLARESWGPVGNELNGLDLFGFRILSSGYPASGGSATGAPAVAALATAEIDEEEMRRTALFVAPEADAPELIGHHFSLGAAVRLIRAD